MKTIYRMGGYYLNENIYRRNIKWKRDELPLQRNFIFNYKTVMSRENIAKLEGY